MHPFLRRSYLSLCVVVALAIPAVGHAAVDYFTNWGGPAPAFTNFAMAGCRMSGENIAATGYRIDPVLPPGAQSMLLQRVNDAGVPVWIQSVDLPGIDFGHDVTETANTDLATAGYTISTVTGLSDMLLTRFTRAGVNTYVRTFAPAGDDFAFGLIEDRTDGGLVVTGMSNSFTPGYALTLFKMAPGGAMPWGFTLGGAAGFAFADRGTYVSRTSDGGWIVTGWTQDMAVGGAVQDLLLVRITPAGAVAWVRTLGYGAGTASEGRSVVEGVDGTIYVVGVTQAGGLGTRNILLARYSPGGGLFFAEQIGNAALTEDYGRSVCVTDNGIAIAGYSVIAPFAEQAVVLNVDPLGAVVWADNYGAAGTDEFRSVMQGGDGRLLLAGRGPIGLGAVNIQYGAVDPTGVGCGLVPMGMIVTAPAPTTSSPAPAPVPIAFAITPAAAAIAVPPGVAGGFCSTPSTLVPYVNTYDNGAINTGFGIAHGVDTGGAVTGSMNPGSASGNPDWSTLRFDPFGAVTWVNTYTIIGISIARGVGIARALVQGWWTVGRTQVNAASPPYPYFLKITDDGSPAGARRITGTAAEPTGIATTSDGGAAITGWTLPAAGSPALFVTKISGTIAYQWTVEVTAAGHTTQGRSIIQASDGGYVVAGVDQDLGAGAPPGLLLVKLDATGTLVWARALQLGAGNSDVGTAVVETASGNYAVAGYNTDTGTGDQNALIAEFSAAGVFQWYTRMSITDVDQVTGMAARGDSLVLCGTSTNYAPGQQMTLAKTNPAGDVLWVRAMYEVGNTTANAVTVTDGGEILVTGDMLVGGFTDMMIGKFNALGVSCRGFGYLPTYSHPSNPFYDPGLASAVVARTTVTPGLFANPDFLTVTNCPAPPAAVGDAPPAPPRHGALDFDVVGSSEGTLECRINPLRPMTLRISLFDLGGRRVGSPVSLGELAAGPQTVRVSIGGIGRGVYTAVAEGQAARAKSKFVHLRD